LIFKDLIISLAVKNTFRSGLNSVTEKTVKWKPSETVGCWFLQL